MTRAKRKGPAACGSASRAVGRGQASSATVSKSKPDDAKIQEILERYSQAIEDGTVTTAVYDGARRTGTVINRGDCFVALGRAKGEPYVLGTFPTQQEAAHAVYLADRLVIGPETTRTAQ